MCILTAQTFLHMSCVMCVCVRVLILFVVSTNIQHYIRRFAFCPEGGRILASLLTLEFKGNEGSNPIFFLFGSTHKHTQRWCTR